MSSPNNPDDGWQPRDWEPSEWQPSDSDSSGDDAGLDDSGYYTPESSTGDTTGGADDYSPYDSGGSDGGFDQAGGAGGYEAPASTDPYGQPSADPYSQPSADPYSQPSGTPYGQPSADPYSQPSATPYGQPSATPYGQPSADQYGQSAPSDPPPSQSFPAYQAPGGGQQGQYGAQQPYGGQQSPYGGQQSPYGGQPVAYGGSPYGPAGVPQNHPRAVPSMVCGIVGMFCCPIVSVVAIVLGIGARREINADPRRWTGGGYALAGIILGSISAVYGVIGWLANIAQWASGN